MIGTWHYKPNPQDIKVVNGVLWIEVENYPGYWVSDTGEILGRRCKKIKGSLDGKGYKRFTIKDLEKRQSTEKAHRFILKQFIPNFENKEQINHKNCDKTDNNINNLEWSTNKENIKHKMLNNLNVAHKGEKHGNAILTEKQAIEIYLSTEKNAILSKRYGVSISTISAIRHNRLWKHVTNGLIVDEEV